MDFACLDSELENLGSAPDSRPGVASFFPAVLVCYTNLFSSDKRNRIRAINRKNSCHGEGANLDPGATYDFLLENFKRRTPYTDTKDTRLLATGKECSNSTREPSDSRALAKKAYKSTVCTVHMT